MSSGSDSYVSIFRWVPAGGGTSVVLELDTVVLTWS